MSESGNVKYFPHIPSQVHPIRGEKHCGLLAILSVDRDVKKAVDLRIEFKFMLSPAVYIYIIYIFLRPRVL